MIQINLHCHNRTHELEKVFKSLLAQKMSFQPKLNVIVDPINNSILGKLTMLIDEYRERLSTLYSLRIYKFSSNVGLASAIYNGLRFFNSKTMPTMILEDDLVLIDEKTIHRVAKIFKAGFKGHVNLWQPNGYYNSDIICTGRHMWCWGWAADPQTLEYFLQYKDYEVRFRDSVKLSIWGFDFINHLVVNLNNKKRTWAVYYYIFVFLNDVKIYNFRKSKVLEVSTWGTNRKTSFLRNQIHKINESMLFVLNLKSMSPNKRYKYTFFLNLYFFFRLSRSIYQIAMYGKSLRKFNVDFPNYHLIEIKNDNMAPKV